MADETHNGDTPDTPPEPTTNELLQQLIADRAQDRASLAEMRAELNAANDRATKARLPVSSVRHTAEELEEMRAEEIAQHAFYCPGCGALYDRERECRGRGEAPHPAIDVVSTDELKGDDPSKHTAAPGVYP